MTTNYRRDWNNTSDIYYSQPAHNNHSERMPNRAIEAIHTRSKKRIVRRYSNPEGYDNQGIPKKGEYEEVELWCFIRTVWAGKKEEAYDVMDTGGVRTEGVMALYYDPYYYLHPPEGIHLHLTNPRNEETKDYSGFADVVEYNGLLWKVTEHNSYDISYGEMKEYMGKATIERFKPSVINESNYTTDNFLVNQTSPRNYRIK